MFLTTVLFCTALHAVCLVLILFFFSAGGDDDEGSLAVLQVKRQDLEKECENMRLETLALRQKKILGVQCIYVCICM